jgi:hypothetical protein
MPYISIDAGRIRPVGFDSDNRESMPFNEPARDCGAGAIEFRRTVRSFAKQDEVGISKTIEEGTEFLGCFRARQMFKLRTERGSERVGVLDPPYLRPSDDTHKITTAFNNEADS